MSLGRHTTPPGSEYVASDRQTFGTKDPVSVIRLRGAGMGLVNSAPRVGPLVISEIQYDPLATGAHPVDTLSCKTSHPLRCRFWSTSEPAKIRCSCGAIDFVLPAGTGGRVAGARVLVVDFSPVSSTWRPCRPVPSSNPPSGDLRPFPKGKANSTMRENISLWEPLSPPAGSITAPYGLVEHVGSVRIVHPGREEASMAAGCPRNVEI